MWIVESLIGAVIVLAIVVVLLITQVVDLPWWPLAPLLVVETAYVLIVPTWRFRVHRWEATATAVYTQKGWWTRERRIAPMSRIQTVDYAEDAIPRLFGLATVTVTTASAAGALTIEGLDKAVAQQLVDELTLAADAVEGDAT